MRRFLFSAICAALLISCSHEAERLVLWTDRVEFVSYAELFNASQDNVKVIALYKDNLASALPPAKSERRPDIIAGTFLRSGMQKKYFSRLDSLFGKHALSKQSFYPSLLEAGRLKKRQYLLPVSFNLPALVFLANNYDYPQEGFLSFSDIKEISQKFNAKDEAGVFSAMAFGPHWNTEFIYLFLKTAGVNYTVKDGSLRYTEDEFQKAIADTIEWSEQINGGVPNEMDFAFRFLYTPFYEQVQSGKSLFAYATSSQIFSLAEDRLDELDFHWICNDEKIQIEDDAVMAGIYSASRNKSAAKEFLLWLLDEDSQKKILERNFAMKLRTQTFGIAGGFSSLQSVNKNAFPLYYRALLPNIPSAEKISAPKILPENWNAIKQNVVIPFIEECVQNPSAPQKTLSERYSEFAEQTTQSKSF